ncbi:DUF4384 domain-containing protein, partial [Candidatus Neomarinimicrobiota bacterium]
LPGMMPDPAETAMLEGAEALEREVAPAEPMDYEVRSGWFIVDTSLVFPSSMAPLEARRQVLQVARAAGLEQAMPPEVSFTSLLSDVMDETAGVVYEKATWSTFALTSLSGYIVDERVLSTALQPLTGDAYRYRMVVEARVEPVKGERDPALRLELDVAERLLTTGDELIIAARSSVDGYLYIFNFLSDQSVMFLFPNSILTGNAIAAGERIEIPSQEERSRGIRYRVAANPEMPTTHETIYAVFSRQPIADIAGLTDVQEGQKIFTAGEESFTRFQRWLAEIPLGQRVEKAVQIHIINEEGITP